MLEMMEAAGGKVLTYLPTISFIVLVKTPFRARARLAAGRERNG